MKYKLVHLRIPVDTLAAIDQLANESGASREGVIAGAINIVLNNLPSPEIRQRVAGTETFERMKANSFAALAVRGGDR